MENYPYLFLFNEKNVTDSVTRGKKGADNGRQE